MASKGQKFQKISPKRKQEILDKYFSRLYSTKMLGEAYGVSFETIKTWIRKTMAGIDVTVEKKKGNSGRPKTNNLTIVDYQERYEILKKYQAFLEARRGKK
jgi:transposase-like protein